MPVALIALGVIAVLVLLFVFLPVVAWIIVGLVLLILALVLLIPVGADIAYVGGAFSLALRADGLSIQMIPRKGPKKEKPPAPEPEQGPDEQSEKPKRKLNLNLNTDEILEILKKTLNGLGKFGKLTVRHFMLHYVAAGEDPYNTAMTYGGVNAALSTLAPVCARNFRVTGETDVRTGVDFTAEHMQLDAELSVTLRLIQAVRALLAAGFGVVGVLIRNKLRLRKEKRQAKKETGDTPGLPEAAPAPDKTGEEAREDGSPDSAEEKDELIPIEEIIKTIQDEERKEDHG